MAHALPCLKALFLVLIVHCISPFFFPSQVIGHDLTCPVVAAMPSFSKGCCCGTCCVCYHANKRHVQACSELHCQDFGRYKWSCFAPGHYAWTLTAVAHLRKWLKSASKLRNAADDLQWLAVAYLTANMLPCLQNCCFKAGGQSRRDCSSSRPAFPPHHRRLRLVPPHHRRLEQGRPLLVEQPERLSEHAEAKP